jgi:hypothetical protein
MAPIDFEKELQERLRSREVKPSPQAWERISARLEEEGPAPSGKPWGWVGLAAASVVILLGFLVLWEPAGESPAMDSVVESPEAQVPGEQQVQQAQDLIADPSTKAADAIVSGEPEAPADRKGSESRTQGVVKNQNSNDVATAIASVEVKQDEAFPGEASVDKAETTVVLEGAPKALPVEQGLDDEIDALLQQAQESIALQQEKDTLSAVDAMTLLDRAEDELDQTFREKIMTKIKSGVTKLRTAVAERRK